LARADPASDVRRDEKEKTMSGREPGSQEDADKAVAAQMMELAEALLARPGSDARAGLGSLVREIEATHPGFIARLNAVNDLQRLGLSLDVATAH
jgi:hypothetical protein